jgi:hypothetical protein
MVVISAMVDLIAPTTNPIRLCMRSAMSALILLLIRVVCTAMDERWRVNLDMYFSLSLPSQHSEPNFNIWIAFAAAQPL